MTKEELNNFFNLERKIIKKAEDLLKWYEKNVNPLKDDLPYDHPDDLPYDYVKGLTYDYVDEDNIWYEKPHGEGTGFRLPTKLLYSEEAKQEYLDNFVKETKLKRPADKKGKGKGEANEDLAKLFKSLNL